MKTIKLLITLIVISLAANGIAHADISPEKRAEIERMIKLTDMEKIWGQILPQSINSMRSRYPKLPNEYFTEIAEKMNAKDLIGRLIPIYDKYYTLEDLKAINAFYSSPAGQKVIVAKSQFDAEAAKICQQWEVEIFQEARDKTLKPKAEGN